MREPEVDELQSAAYKGDWRTATGIIYNNSIGRDHEEVKRSLASVLLTAVFRRHSEFFVEILKPVRDPQILTGVIDHGNVLHYVAGDGNLKQAKALVDKCPSLVMTYTSGLTPLHIAVVRANDKDLVWYLTLVTRDRDPNHLCSGHHVAFLIFCLMVAGYHDIIHFLLQRYHNLAEVIISGQNPYDNKPILCQLASKPSEFRSGTKLRWLGCCIYPVIPVEVDHVVPTQTCTTTSTGSFHTYQNAYFNAINHFSISSTSIPTPCLEPGGKISPGSASDWGYKVET